MLSDGLVDKKEFQESKMLDPFYILQLVKENPNDQELGKQIRHYVLFNIPDLHGKKD